MKYDMTVLIVEDDSIQLKLLERLVRDSYERAHVLTATNVPEALEVIQNCHLDGCITDLVLDNETGFHVAQMCKERGIAAVFLTATNDDHNKRQMYLMGAVIEKPASLPAVSWAVNDYIKTHAKVRGRCCKERCL